MLDNINSYNKFILKNNFLKFKIKFKSIIKKYQPLRFCVYIYSLFLIQNKILFIITFKKNNSIQNIKNFFLY